MKPLVTAKYVDFNATKEKSYYDYTNYIIKYGIIDKYVITGVIGKGRYAEVFKGREKEIKKKIVIKVLKPIKQMKVNREVLILQHLKSHSSIIELKDVVYDKQTKLSSLIFDFIEHSDCHSVFTRCPFDDVISYSKQLLEGLSHAHSRGIIHRDIKPGNLIVSPRVKSLKIIDWGLAEFYHPGKSYSVRVASKYYKAPELLVEDQYYDYSIDIWAFGTTLAEWVTERQPFFYVLKKTDCMLYEIAKLLGKKDLRKFLKKHDLDSNEAVRNVLQSKKIPEERQPISKLIKSPQFAVIVPLLEKILVYDYTLRPTAEELLKEEIYIEKKE
ncbi:hypothetical protein NUSPORA_02492 [Nucleospora cyclopteri]